MIIHNTDYHILKPVKPIQPSVHIRKIPGFTNYFHTIEKNINNNAVFNNSTKILTEQNSSSYFSNTKSSNKTLNYVSSETAYEPIMLIYNLKKNFFNLYPSINAKQSKNNISDTSNMKDFIPLEKSVSTIITHKKITNLTKNQAVTKLKECSSSILNSSCEFSLAYASYLLSVTAVISLLNPKLEDN